VKPSIALIGPGRVGCAIGKRLYQSGYPLTAIISRDRTRAVEASTFVGCSTAVASDQLSAAITAKIILLAVPDDQIKTVARQLQREGVLTAQMTIVHFSGLHPAEMVRDNCHPATALLSLHPLLPFASREVAFEALSGCPCALESSCRQALILGEQLVDAIGGRCFTIASEKKVLYHTAASMASNYFVTLFASARDLLEKCGIDAEQATALLLPLVQASLNNVQKLGAEQGLTGPIVRGDCGTVAKHIEALQNAAPELLTLYQQMGEQTALLSQKSSRLDTASSNAIQTLLKTALKPLQ